MNARPGCTLVELVVALLVFTVGALALAATAAFVGRQMTDSGIRDRALRTASTRLELVAAECETARSGTEMVRSVLSRWTVSPLDSARVRVTESVSYVTGRGLRTDVYEGIIACGQ